MIRGSNRVISNRPPAASFGIHNRFDIEVIDAETGLLKREAKAYNVICNQLWTRLFAKQQYFSYIQYGSGDGTPSASDTSLFNYVGGQAASGETASIDYEKGVFSLRKQIQLAAGAAVGVTVTEVGIAYGSNSSYLCTHAMLEDMNGNHVSIVKTDTDVINIYATVYVHFNPHGYDGGYIRPVTCVPTRGLFATLCGHGTEYPDRMYMTQFDTADMQSSNLGGYPKKGGTGTADYVSASVACDAASKTITFTLARLESNAHNIGGFRYLNLWRYSYGSTTNMYEPWCIIRPGGSWFPYSQVTSEAVGTGDGSTVDYSLKFPFVHDVKVYVDGVETTDFTYDYAPNTTTQFGYYMQELDMASTPDNHIPRIRTWHTRTPQNARIWYNPAYELGVSTVACYQVADAYVSDDLDTWHLIGPSTGGGQSGRLVDVPSEYAHYRYWKLTEAKNNNYNVESFALNPPSTFTGKTLHFNTPPAAGAVITADYKTDTVAKDENHVFDLSVTIQLGEYVEG